MNSSCYYFDESLCDGGRVDHLSFKNNLHIRSKELSLRKFSSGACEQCSSANCLEEYDVSPYVYSNNSSEKCYNNCDSFCCNCASFVGATTSARNNPHKQCESASSSFEKDKRFAEKGFVRNGSRKAVPFNTSMDGFSCNRPNNKSIFMVDFRETPSDYLHKDRNATSDLKHCIDETGVAATRKRKLKNKISNNLDYEAGSINYSIKPPEHNDHERFYSNEIRYNSKFSKYKSIAQSLSRKLNEGSYADSELDNSSFELPRKYVVYKCDSKTKAWLPHHYTTDRYRLA